MGNFDFDSKSLTHVKVVRGSPNFSLRKLRLKLVEESPSNKESDFECGTFYCEKIVEISSEIIEERNCWSLAARLNPCPLS